MGTGGRVIFRRANNGGRRRRREDDDDDDDDDEEYIVDEEEEEEDDDDEADPGDESESGGEEEEDEEDDEIGESDASFDEEDEEFDDEEDEFEAEAPRSKPKRGRKATGGKKTKAKPRSRRRSDDDEDYEENVEEEEEEDDDEEELDDEDFDPEEEDEELELSSISTKKARAKKELARRKPAAMRRRRRRRKKNSRVSKRKPAAKKPTRKNTAVKRRRRKRSVLDDDEEDEDFIVKDRVEVMRQRPSKKAKVGRRKRAASPEPVAVASEFWPVVDSDTSDFEFVTSDEDFVENRAAPADPGRVKGKKGRRRRITGSEPSDSDYVISEEELRDLGVIGPPPVTPLLLPPPLPRRFFTGQKGVDKKGKEKKGADEAGTPVCGICLSEEQAVTVQGVLNCCSHYFCFACIMEWSKVESRCPLCKRRFATITKSSKSDLGLGLRKAVIRVEKRDQVYQPSEEEMRRWLDPYENVVCIECNQGGDDNLMLLCDICDSSAHTYCVGLGREVPEGNWYCELCRSGGEGPSHVQVQDRVAHRGENNNGSVDGNSEAYGTTPHSGMYQRSTSLSSQPSLQEIDLNLSPRDLPEEDQPAASQVAAGGASTPTGRRATLSGRRAIHQHIRILLSNTRPRQAVVRVDNGIQHNNTMPGIEQSRENFHGSTEVSSSQRVDDGVQNQQNSWPFIQSRGNFTPCTYGNGSNSKHIEGAKEKVQRMVKSNLKHLCTQSPLDHSTFKNVARRATHTVLAACGMEHNRDMVAAILRPPSNCSHNLDGQEPAFLMRNCCSSCFSSFVNDVVKNIMSMVS